MTDPELLRMPPGQLDREILLATDAIRVLERRVKDCERLKARREGERRREGGRGTGWGMRMEMSR